MSTILRTFAPILFVTLLATDLWAGSLNTPPLTRGPCTFGDSNYFYCMVVNAGKKPIEAKIELVAADLSGQEGLVFSIVTVNVPPGAIGQAWHACQPFGDTGPTTAFCRVSGRGVTRRNARVTLQSYPQFGECDRDIYSEPHCAAVSTR